MLLQLEKKVMLKLNKHSNIAISSCIGWGAILRHDSLLCKIRHSSSRGQLSTNEGRQAVNNGNQPHPSNGQFWETFRLLLRGSKRIKLLVLSEALSIMNTYINFYFFQVPVSLCPSLFSNYLLQDSFQSLFWLNSRQNHEQCSGSTEEAYLRLE